MKLFDAHCHVLPPEAFARATEAGVEKIAVCGTSPDDWPRVFQCLEKPDSDFPILGKAKCAPAQVVPMIGIHPWFVKGRDSSPLSAEALAKEESCPDDPNRPAVEPCLQNFQTLEKLLRENPRAGIGETGLDFRARFTNRAEQEACFAAHLDLARELNRPVAVHCVQAWGRLMEILRKHPAPTIILHAYSGSVELIPELIKLNGWFSFGEAVMNPKAKQARAAVAAVPTDRLLIETDADGHPEKLIEVARVVAELRSVSVEDIAALTFNNAQALFCNGY